MIKERKMEQQYSLVEIYPSYDSDEFQKNRQFTK